MEPKKNFLAHIPNVILPHPEGPEHRHQLGDHLSIFQDKPTSKVKDTKEANRNWENFIARKKDSKRLIFSRSILARKTELNLKLYSETLKVYPQVKFLGITFDSQLNFKKHFEDILDRCNTRYHHLRLLADQKWGPSPSTLI